jgi:uncharacterized SAM-binding protein YcdF (DUF218 family)
VKDASGSKPAFFSLANLWRCLKGHPFRSALILATATLLALYGIPVAKYLAGRPLVVLWLASAVAVASLWWRRQDKRRRLVVLTVAFALLTLYFLPATSSLLCGALESRHPPLDRRPGDIEAIVVLAGTLRPAEAKGLPVEPGENTMYRCLRAATMYHQGRRCPVIVSGGQVDPARPGPSCAKVMKDFLIRAGVAAADIIEEDAAQSTYENAVLTAHLLRARGLRKVLLVTDGLHMDRAMRCFQKQGVDVVACGCSYRALYFEWSVREFMPNPGAAQGVRAALHEHVGLAWYSVQEWI